MDELCTACGKSLDGHCAYASFGGSLIPYIPSKFYHIGCVPTIKPADAEQKCYAVVFINYHPFEVDSHPLEVDSLWKTREGAKTHIQELTNPSNWDICEMEIRGS